MISSPNLCPIQLDGVNHNGPTGNPEHESAEPVKVNSFWLEQLTPGVDVQFAGEPMETFLKFIQKGMTINVGGQATFGLDCEVDHTFTVPKARNTQFFTAFYNRDIARKFEWLRVPRNGMEHHKGAPKTGDEGMMAIFILLVSVAAVATVRTAKSRG